MDDDYNNDINSKKQWATYNDNRIIEAALYHESRGKTRKADVEKIFERFMEFKNYIRRGSFTLPQLEETVYGMFGLMPTEEDNPVHDFLRSLQDIVRDEKRKTNSNEGKKEKN